MIFSSFGSLSHSFLKIMQALVEHYSSKGWLQRVEQCVLHMDISSLDFNQVLVGSFTLYFLVKQLLLIGVYLFNCLMLMYDDFF